jgi:hypothetical protein
MIFLLESRFLALALPRPYIRKSGLIVTGRVWLFEGF